jgi:hypothetical protein
MKMEMRMVIKDTAAKARWENMIGILAITMIMIVDDVGDWYE